MSEPVAEQLGFTGMPRRLFQAAPSRLTTFMDCPRRYRFAYLDRPPPPKGPPWAHNSFGAAVHTALANWWKQPRARRTVDRGGQLVDEAWLSDGYRDDVQREAMRVRARQMVERYLDTLDPDDEPVGVERTVALKTDHAALFGRVDRIDRIDRRDDELAIVDYKTGRRPLTTDDARTSIALAIYAAAAARTLRRACRRVELHHLPTGEVLAWEHTPTSLERQLGRADAVADEIGHLDGRFRSGVPAAVADELYPARPGPMCAWCDFNKACPAGSATVRPREPWAGLDDPVPPTSTTEGMSA